MARLKVYLPPCAASGNLSVDLLYPNTHLTGEALGLFYLGTLLPEFKSALRWREIGQTILCAELERHVKPDGVYFEQSSYYHRYTADFYLHFYLLAQANNVAVGEIVREKLIALLDHLLHLTKPDGTTPLVGDDDGGRLVVLDERAPNDFRATLATGAAVFSRADHKYVAEDVSEETLWLLGGDGLRVFDQLGARPPGEESRAFPDGGYYVMRDGWSRTANYLLIDCGPHGVFNCGHAHADALAFELAARGRTLLVDPGTYTYTSSPQMRDHFRSSAAHNTLTVDGVSSSLSDGPFAWKHIARTSVKEWQSERRFDYLEASHDGYSSLDAPAMHTRSVLFIKGDYWIVRDRVETAGTHSYDLNFHYAAGAAPTIESDAGAAAMVSERSAAGGLDLCTFGERGAWRQEEAPVSRFYGDLSAAPLLTYSARSEGAAEFVTF
ncbi:MAG: alginate lyase family protein [Pyrinomonadaceae bacterium]